MVRIRDADVEDADAIRAVHEASIRGLGPEGYDDEQVEAWAAGCGDADYESSITGAGEFVVAVREEEIVGFGSLQYDAPEEYETDGDAEVTGIYVHPSVAGEGVGSRLYEELEGRARDRGVDTLVLSASRTAVGFYESHGFRRVRQYSHEFSSHVSTDVEGTVVEMVIRL